MTREEAKEIFLNRGFVNGLFDGDKWRESIVVISKWLEQEPCEDCISRARVVEWLEKCTDDSIEHAINTNLEFIPPITPKPKTDVLDKIRAEIIELRSRQNVGVLECLDIIDKYTAESEG